MSSYDNWVWVTSFDVHSTRLCMTTGSFFSFSTGAVDALFTGIHLYGRDLVHVTREHVTSNCCWYMHDDPIPHGLFTLHFSE
jgi:hypothetical protein